MNAFRKLSLALAAAAAVASFSTVLAGDTPTRPERPGRPPQVEIPKLGIPRNATLPEDLKKLVEQYQTAAKKFAEDQKDLIAKIRGATDAEKAALKDQLKGNREKFLEDTKQLRADIREQVRDLRDKLKENGGAVDGGTEGKGKGRGNRP
jgi:hypothetical protein